MKRTIPAASYDSLIRIAQTALAYGVSSALPYVIGGLEFDIARALVATTDVGPKLAWTLARGTAGLIAMAAPPPVEAGANGKRQLAVAQAQGRHWEHAQAFPAFLRSRTDLGLVPNEALIAARWTQWFELLACAKSSPRGLSEGQAHNLLIIASAVLTHSVSSSSGGWRSPAVPMTAEQACEIATHLIKIAEKSRPPKAPAKKTFVAKFAHRSEVEAHELALASLPEALEGIRIAYHETEWKKLARRWWVEWYALHVPRVMAELLRLEADEKARRAAKKKPEPVVVAHGKNGWKSTGSTVKMAVSKAKATGPTIKVAVKETRRKK